MARRKIRSNQHARRRQDDRRRRFRFYAVASIFLLVLLVGVTHWKALQVQDINVEAGEYAKPNLVKDLAENILNEPVLGVISRKNILLLPRKDIYLKVRQISSRIQKVDIDVVGLRSITIKITDRQPAAEVCNQPAGRSLQGCYFVDAAGFIFSRVDEATTTSQIMYVSGLELQARTQLLPPDDFQDLHAFVQALGDIDLETNLVYLKEYGDVAISVTDGRGDEQGSVDIRINRHDDLPQVLANLQTVIENKSFVASTPTNGETPETISPFSLEYIDMRFENKVFYK